MEFSGSGGSPAGHNPLRVSSRRRGWCHTCQVLSCLFLRLNCPALLWCLCWLSAVPAPLPGSCCCGWHLCLAGRAGRWWHHGAPGDNAAAAATVLARSCPLLPAQKEAGSRVSPAFSLVSARAVQLVSRSNLKNNPGEEV